MAEDRCPTCGNHGVDGWHRNRCAYLADLRAQVEAHGAKLGIPAPVAFDLFAHMRTIDDDGAGALRRAVAVMDLGWRPTVGAP